MSEMIRLEMNNGVATLRLDRPPANALDLSFITALADAFAELEGRGDVRAVVVTGTGRFFSAGLDLKAIPGYGHDEQRALATNLNRMVGRLYGLPLPVVAAVNGHCIAGGVIVALSCDYRVVNARQGGGAHLPLDAPETRARQRGHLFGNLQGSW